MVRYFFNSIRMNSDEVKVVVGEDQIEEYKRLLMEFKTNDKAANDAKLLEEVENLMYKTRDDVKHTNSSVTKHLKVQII